MLPAVNGAALPRHIRTGMPSQDASKNKWQGCYMVSLTLFASAILATLVTFGVLNFLLNGMTLPPVSSQTGLLQTLPPTQQEGGSATAEQQQQQLIVGGPPPDAAASSIGEVPSEALADPPPLTKAPPPVYHHMFDDVQNLYPLPGTDESPRCKQSKICDGDHSCGPDNRGCVTSAKERQDAVRKAIAWAWEGYRKYAWGHDEVDVLSKSPHAWFNLGLTIVDSLDTLLIAGLMDEYHQARHWVANHLVFHDGSNVQFFEVNIRILGGLVSAYYLSGGDDLYLHKAEQLSDRLLVAFNTSSGVPVTHVPLRDAAGRRGSGMPDAQTNIAEAGTISMEFTSIGRLLGRDDLFDAGMQFWYVLMSSRNFSGLYCMGIHTSKADCYNPMMTIGSAADSTYEYMLKQWVMSNHTQLVPLQLYKESMKGVRKYLVRHIYDGHAEGSMVSEARADQGSGAIGDTNNRFEHLTCFAGGMFVLGALHGVNTQVDDDDFDDVVLGARIGRTCYEMYHQTASGLAPDSVTYKRANGQQLPSRDQDTVRPPGTIKHRPGARHAEAAPQPTLATQGAEAQQPAVNPERLAPVQDATAPDASKPLNAAVAGNAEQPSAQGGAGGTQTARRLQQLPAEEGAEGEELVHKGRRIMAIDDAEFEQQKPLPRIPVYTHERYQLAEAQHRRHVMQMHAEQQDSEEEEARLRYRRRMHADRDPSSAGQQPEQQAQQPVDDGAHGPDAVRSAREREAAAAALQRLHAQQAADALHRQELQHQSTAQQRQQLTEVQHVLHEQLRQQQEQVLAQQQQHHAPGHSAPGHSAATHRHRLHGGHNAQHSAAPSHTSEPQPTGPVVASAHQMTGADFLRPETIETLFYLWRATGDEVYREWGWNMFRAFERWTRLESGGYATLSNVNTVPPGLANKMESFWLAETLKYFYLLFEDDPNVLPLDQWVFNTEAHPLPVWGSTVDKQAMERLKKRRHAAKVEQKRREAEEEAVEELKEIKRQGAVLAKQAPQLGKPADRQGYGLGGVEMF